VFNLPPLPYAVDALAPHMSAETFSYHHGKHHAAYINNMNAALKDRANAPSKLEDVVALAVREKDQKLFNNAAQSWNHGFFWQSMAPKGGGEPQGALKAAIDAAFGSTAAFREQFADKGAGHFASGWAWLVSDRNGAVSLIDTHDADTAITLDGVTPLIVCDVWEHAYYIDYRNERPRFLKAFAENLLNWRFAESQYAAAKSGAGGWVFPT
jgi:Fe-Mn family superoxide dismutase